MSAAGVLSGCAGYEPRPLAAKPGLAASLSQLDRTVPAASAAGDPPRQIDVKRPLSIDDIGLLAILNDPGLKSERGAFGVAEAGVIAARLLPNPVVGLSLAPVVGGPGTTTAYAASLGQDIQSLVTYRARLGAAEAHLSSVNANLLWREWQVAQEARRLALGIYWEDRSLVLLEREHRVLEREAALVRKAVAAGNLDLSALSALLAALAANEHSLSAMTLARLSDWQALDALLGVVPSLRFSIARPVVPPPPADFERLVANLPARRPDLVALQLGYHSAEEELRAAILGQFPSFTLGAAYGRDTTAVVSTGPEVSFALPILNQNQGAIAKADATRTLLRAEYEARVDHAVGAARGLRVEIARLTAILARAKAAAAAAASLLAGARRAYEEGNLDQRALADYETTATERALDVASFERRLGEDRISLAVNLGLGLPAARLVADGRTAPR